MIDAARCAFCRQHQAGRRRVPTIYGAAHVCRDCLRRYRAQLAWAVQVVNHQRLNSPQFRDQAA